MEMIAGWLTCGFIAFVMLFLTTGKIKDWTDFGIAMLAFLLCLFFGPIAIIVVVIDFIYRD